MREFFYDLDMCPTLEEIHAVLGKQHTPPRVRAHFAKQRTRRTEHGEKTVQTTTVMDDEESCTSGSNLTVTTDPAPSRKERPPSNDAATDTLDHMATRDVWDIALHHRLPDAAKLLNVSCTRLKDFCRERGIAQWPRRVASSLKTLLSFPRTTDEERRVIERLLANSFHNRFVFSETTRVLLETCKRRMYRFRYKKKIATGLKTVSET